MTSALRDRLRGLGRRLRRMGRAAVRAGLVIFALTALVSTWGMLRTPVAHPVRPPVVNDVTRLNPIRVAAVITPTTTAEIVDAVRRHPGPIAIGGGRYSMGGQTATPGALHIDMRRFDRVLAFDSVRRTMTVQAGIRWRQIQERVDAAGLAVTIMQTYANFTVGGSLSVNVHGRYVGLGPLILSVRSIQVVLADGSLVEASPTQRPDVFYGVIGGYGGLGVITEATLDLAENVRVKRVDRVLPVTAYRRFFEDSVRGTAALFHNADLYPPHYAAVRALTYAVTDDPVTVPDRLIPAEQPYRLNRFIFWAISEWPGGKWLRQHVVDPLRFLGTAPVTWRNYEASYDVAELEPTSRRATTYVLQEYFVPVERFDDFVPRLRTVLNRHRVNAINVSIRHARADPGSLLAWARGEVFAFVLYYKQGTAAAARDSVGVWTRELIDQVLALGGTYYLPYQIHATRDQFLRAYPRAPEFFALKRRLDPTDKFRNALWDAYDPASPQAEPGVSAALRAQLDTTTAYRRDEGQTFLTHPEWYIVYNSDEYAAWLRDRLPTAFPYAKSAGQFWVHYREANRLARGVAPFNWAYQVMLMVIGTSYSVELTLKGVYENTVGRLSGWTSGGALSDEDRYAAEVAADYGRFIHVRPWYEYRFAARFAALWTALPWWGAHPARKWERKLFLSLEYGVKAVYAALIRLATHTAYGVAEDRVGMVVREGGRDTLVTAPRYDAFRDTIRALAAADHAPGILEIAGNDEILLTGLAPVGWQYAGAHGSMAYTVPLASDPGCLRFALRTPVRDLLATVREVQAVGRAVVDHIYDY